MFAVLLFLTLMAPPQTERVGLRLIAVKTEAEANNILNLLQAGQQFEALARRYSTDASARAGGDLGSLIVRDLRPEFQEGIKGLRPGQVSGFIRLNGGIVLLQVAAAEDPRAGDLMEAATKGDALAVKALIDAGVHPSQSLENGLTPLMNAAFGGHTETVRVLLAGGADSNARLNNGSTALMAAALGGHLDIVRALIAAGAQVKLATTDGGTALTEAAHGGHVEVLRALLSAGADVTDTLANGSNALMAAALGGHVEAMQVLLDAGAKVEAKDKRGWTALTYATAAAQMDAVKALLFTVGETERHVIVGSVHANDYYATSDPAVLDMAAAEFRAALAADPQNLAALQWQGAVEVLRWGPEITLQQFRTANALLKKAAALDPQDAERQYWVAAVNWMFAARGKGATPTEMTAILDEGLEHATKAIVLDPMYADAMAYMGLLYIEHAKRASKPADRDRFLRFANASAQNVLKAGNRPPKPNDQFSRPAAPPPPL